MNNKISVDIGQDSGEFKSIKDQPIVFNTTTPIFQKEIDVEDLPHVLMVGCTSPLSDGKKFCFGAMANYSIRNSDGFHSMVNSLFEQMKRSKMVLTHAIACIPESGYKSPTLMGYLELFARKLTPSEMKNVHVVGFDPKKKHTFSCTFTPIKDDLNFKYFIA